MNWLLLVVTATTAQPMAGPFETREMCESHKIEFLLSTHPSNYAYLANKLECHPGSTQEKRR